MPRRGQHRPVPGPAHHGVPAPERSRRVQRHQLRFQRSNRQPHGIVAPPRRRRAAFRQVVNLPAQPANVGYAAFQPLPLRRGQAAPPVDLTQQQCGQLLSPGQRIRHQLLAVGRSHFRRRRRRRRAPVGHIVGNRPVGFVADPGNDRNAAGENGPRHFLGIETPQILQRPAPPGHNDHLRPLFRIQSSDGAGNLPGRPLALHRRRRQTQFGQRIPPPGYILNILPHRPRRRGHHPDNPGEQRQRALARGVKQPLRFQLLAEPGQLQRQSPGAHRCHSAHLHIGLAARRVESETAPGQHLLPFRQVFLPGTAPEHHAAQRTAPIPPQAEVRMAGTGGTQVGNLPLHRQPRQQAVRLQLVFEISRNLAYRVHYGRQHRVSGGGGRITGYD